MRSLCQRRHSLFHQLRPRAPKTRDCNHECKARGRAQWGVFVQIGISLCKHNLPIKWCHHRKTLVAPPYFIDDNVLRYKLIYMTSPRKCTYLSVRLHHYWSVSLTEDLSPAKVKEKQYTRNNLLKGLEWHYCKWGHHTQTLIPSLDKRLLYANRNARCLCCDLKYWDVCWQNYYIIFCLCTKWTAWNSPNCNVSLNLS